MSSSSSQCNIINLRHPFYADSLKCFNCSFSWLNETKCLSQRTKKFNGQRFCRFCYYVTNNEIRFLETGLDWRVKLCPKSAFYCCRCKWDIRAHHKLSTNPRETVYLCYNFEFPFHRYCIVCYRYVTTVLPHKLDSLNCCRKL